jgi:hypothetical protein
MRKLSAALALALGFATEVSCTDESEPQSQTGLTLKAVHYVSDWTWGSATSLAPRRGFQVTTNLGYVVEVHAGYLVTSSVSLSPCQGDDDALSLGPVRASLLPVAQAGHDDVADPSQLPHGRVEDLGAPGANDLAYLEVPNTPYCRLHYLVARAGGDTTGLPSDVDLERTSLHLEGTFLAPGETEARPFLVHSSVANGLLWDLEAQGPCQTECVARIRVHRALDALFQDIVFTTSSEPDLGRQILQNLIDTARVTVSLEDDPA